MSTTKTYAIAIACGGYPHVFAQTAPNEVAATIDALRVLYGHLSDHDARYDFYEKCLPFCEGLEAQNFVTLEALQQAIEDANEDAPETIIIGHYAEEVVSCLWHLYQADRWKSRAYKLLRAAKGYKRELFFEQGRVEFWEDAYLGTCREAHKEFEAKDALVNRARILHIGFLAAGFGLGLIAYHLIF